MLDLTYTPRRIQKGIDSFFQAGLFSGEPTSQGCTVILCHSKWIVCMFRDATNGIGCKGFWSELHWCLNHRASLGMIGELGYWYLRWKGHFPRGEMQVNNSPLPKRFGLELTYFSFSKWIVSVIRNRTMKYTHSWAVERRPWLFGTCVRGSTYVFF